jgi:hypothetical protein
VKVLLAEDGKQRQSMSRLKCLVLVNVGNEAASRELVNDIQGAVKRKWA